MYFYKKVVFFDLMMLNIRGNNKSTYRTELTNPWIQDVY